MNTSNPRLINQGVENLRRTNLLEIFLDHLIAISTKALEFHSVMVTKSYLSQARRLCKFYHNYGCDVGAKEYLNKIQSLDEELEILYVKEDFTLSHPPSLPVRISIEPSMTSSASCSPIDVKVKPPLEEIGQQKEIQPCNLYEEMVPQEEISANEAKKSSKNLRSKSNSITEENVASEDLPLSELKKSLKLRTHSPSISEEEEDGELVVSQQTRNSNEACISIKPSAEPRKSIKFHNVVIKVQKGDINPIQRPEGYSPVSILRSKSERTEDAREDSDDDDDDEHEMNEPTIIPSSTANKESSAFLPSLFKSSSDFIKSSPLGNTEIFQNLSQNTDKFIHHISTDDKKAQIRDMLKRKTLQLKGVFNQSSDS